MMMPFSEHNINPDPHRKKHELEHLTTDIRKKRVLSLVTGNRQASLTIETALVLPIFVFAMIMLVMISDALCLYVNVQRALHQNAKEAAMLSHCEHISEDEWYASVLEDIGTAYLDRAPMVDGSRGISFDGSYIMQQDFIHLQASYRLQFPYDMFGVGNIPMTQRSLMHAWVGYGDTFEEMQDGTEEQTVYITPYGTVYHLSPECSHLRLSIREIRAGEEGGLRNKDGGRYKDCELCYMEESSILYITDTGDRYHSHMNCSGLKRVIMTIPISEAGSRGLCSRCKHE